jgi:cell wall assembly regulator SMI1
MIDEPRLVRALDEVASHLARLGSTAARLLRPGLSPPAIAQEESKLPFRLTEEIRAVYRWRDGVRAADGKVMADLWFFPGFYLPCLEDAVQEFRDRRFGAQWRKGWFPLFADGGGDFYNVPCTKQPMDSAPVIRFRHGEPDQSVEFLDVTTMIETLADSYSQGAFFLDPDGVLDLNDDAYARIARQHNPGVDAWQR